MSYQIRGEFLQTTRQYFEALPDIAEHAAMLALNQASEREAVPMIRREAESQIAFPPGHLDDPERLEVSRKATRASLEVVISARDRPTSLARFAPGQTPESTKGTGVTVQVKRGRAKHLKKAFLVRLKNGNVGLAVRLKQGETLANKREIKAVQLDRNLYLLYGPSVDQVVRTVAAELLPAIGDMVSKEFFRQFARLSHG